MDCPSCGTWNPDDKVHCFRCGTELPKPPEPKKKRQISSQTWVWVIAILIFVVSMLAQCGYLRIGGDGDSVGLLTVFGETCRSLFLI
jgi:hypothetical protein